MLEFNFAARSDVGAQRELNEDSGLANETLLVVADGLGGHAAGELASSTAISVVSDLDLSDISTQKIETKLSNATKDIAQKLLEQSTKHSERSGLGTTLSLVQLRANNEATIFHIGDSRVYHLRDGAFRRLTKDHTYVQKLIDAGDLTEIEAAHHPQRSLLTQAIDGITTSEGDLLTIPAKEGDKFLVCTDGLTAVVDDDEIANVVEDLEPAAAVTKLVDVAIDRGAPDNITVMVAQTRAKSESKGREPIVVGAAAVSKNRRSLSQLNFPADEMPSATEPVTAQSQSDTAKKRNQNSLRLIIITALVTLSFASLATYASLIGTQIFVGAKDGMVTIFRGIPQTVLFVQLHRPIETTNLSISGFPSFEQQQIVNGISVSNEQGARDLVEELRQRQQQVD